ncbi:hypothetical protein HK107_06870 [Parvularcula sp. ZS-1/3]|uniref:VPLPA-CTERM sorting domain-containing protein n=1 Tax=Parvularcula mediterranea TaxID=2732508 RepID=A0A7Y3W5A0_9PROT|nr:hypothetical protein [Parvularcula mediterranea]NNU16041.1 hypothetical protein [Parvularcula mediterranea]
MTALGASAALMVSQAMASTVFVEIDLSLFDNSGFEDDDDLGTLALSEDDSITIYLEFDMNPFIGDISDVESNPIGNGFFADFAEIQVFSNMGDEFDVFSEAFGSLDVITEQADFGPFTGFFLSGFDEFNEYSFFIDTSLDLGLGLDSTFLEAMTALKDLVENGDVFNDFQAVLFADPLAALDFGTCVFDDTDCIYDFFVEDIRISDLPDVAPIPIPGALPLFLAGAGLFGLKRKLAKA